MKATETSRGFVEVAPLREQSLHPFPTDSGPRKTNGEGDVVDV